MNVYIQTLIYTNIELIKLKLKKTIIWKDIDEEQHLNHEIFHNKNMQRLVSTEWISQ